MYNIKALTVKIIAGILLLLSVSIAGYIIELKLDISEYEKNIISLQSEIMVARYQLERQNSQIERLKVDIINAKIKLTDEIKKINAKYQIQISLLDKNYNESCEKKLTNIDKIYKEWVGIDANYSDQ